MGKKSKTAEGNKIRKEILDFMYDYCLQSNVFPSINLLAQRFEGRIGKTTIHYHLGVLEKEGKLKRVGDSGQHYLPEDIFYTRGL